MRTRTSSHGTPAVAGCDWTGGLAVCAASSPISRSASAASTATILRAEVLHAIIAHRSGGKPLTLEAGIVRVADALDMAKGRSRIPFEAGSVSMHSLSAAAIDEVTIEDGEDKPVKIGILMNNSSGLYQVDGLLKVKLRGSGLEPYVEVIAHIDTEAEKRLVPLYQLDL